MSARQRNRIGIKLTVIKDVRAGRNNHLKMSAETGIAINSNNSSRHQIKLLLKHNSMLNKYAVATQKRWNLAILPAGTIVPKARSGRKIVCCGRRKGHKQGKKQEKAANKAVHWTKLMKNLVLVHSKLLDIL